MGANHTIYARGVLLGSEPPGPKRPPNNTAGTISIVDSLFHAEWSFCPIKGYLPTGSLLKGISL
ncbi:MAG TPA: hypothetical protein VEH06_12865 [Candidatus Bathyarchaeia archaeon]|nr:hypothetical protein [Candidatus Bathyarchaeia archaeon]